MESFICYWKFYQKKTRKNLDTYDYKTNYNPFRKEIRMEIYHKLQFFKRCIKEWKFSRVSVQDF